MKKCLFLHFCFVAFAVLALTGCDNLPTESPATEDYNIIGTGTVTYDGNPRIVSVTPREGKSAGAVTVKYDGDTTPPSEVGEYTVTFDVAAAAGWGAASGLSAGTLKIIAPVPNNQTPAAADFAVGNLTQTAGSVSDVTVTPKQGKSSGEITIYYQGESGTTYAKSAALPTAAGTYAVTFDVAEAPGWDPITGLPGGTLVINAPATPGKVEHYWVDQHDKLVTTSGGVVTIAAGSTLAITAQSSGYIVKQWYLNGLITAEAGNTYSFSSATAGQHIVGLFVEKDGKLYNTNITITITVQ